MQAICAGASLGHLQVGHTHEDVDAFFGTISQSLREGDDDIQTPQDIVKLLDAKLSYLFRKRGEDFKVIYMNLVRPWKSLLPNVTKMEKVYLTRDTANDDEKEIPHMFIFMARRGVVSCCWLVDLYYFKPVFALFV